MIGPDRFGAPIALSETMPTTQKPRKAILSQEQLTQFQNSQCHKNVVSYIEALNASVTGVKLSDECSQSPVRTTSPGSVTEW
jgi:serine/threonine-protein phosphatase 2A activator